VDDAVAEDVEDLIGDCSVERRDQLHHDHAAVALLDAEVLVERLAAQIALDLRGVALAQRTYALHMVEELLRGRQGARRLLQGVVLRVFVEVAGVSVVRRRYRHGPILYPDHLPLAPPAVRSTEAGPSKTKLARRRLRRPAED